MSVQLTHATPGVRAGSGTRSWAAWASRLVLVPPALLLTLISLRFLADPVHAIAATGVTLSTPEALTDSRVVGALGLTLAAVLAFTLLSRQRLRLAHLLVILFMGMALAIRIFGFVHDGTTLATGDQRTKTVGEIVFLVFNVIGAVVQTTGSTCGQPVIEDKRRTTDWDSRK